MNIVDQFIIESELYQSIQDISAARIVGEIESCVGLIECIEKEQRILESSISMDDDEMSFYFEASNESDKKDDTDDNKRAIAFADWYAAMGSPHSLSSDPDMLHSATSSNIRRAADSAVNSIRELIVGGTNFVTGVINKIGSLLRTLFVKSSPEHFKRSIKKLINDNEKMDKVNLKDFLTDSQISKINELLKEMHASSLVVAEIAKNINEIYSGDDLRIKKFKEYDEKAKSIENDKKLSKEETARLKAELRAKCITSIEVLMRTERMNVYNETYLCAVNQSLDLYRYLYENKKVDDIIEDRKKAMASCEEYFKGIYDKGLANAPQHKFNTFEDIMDAEYKSMKQIDAEIDKISRLKKYLNYKHYTDFSVRLATDEYVYQSSAYILSDRAYDEDAEKLKKKYHPDKESAKNNTDNEKNEKNNKVNYSSDLKTLVSMDIKRTEFLNDNYKDIKKLINGSIKLTKETYKISMKYYKAYFKSGNEILEIIKDGISKYNKNKKDEKKKDENVNESAFESEYEFFEPIEESSFEYMSRIIDGGYCELIMEAPSPEADTDTLVQKLAAAFEKFKGFLRSIFVHSSPEYLAKVISKMDDNAFAKFAKDPSNQLRFRVLGFVSAMNGEIINDIDEGGVATKTNEYLKFVDYVIQLLIGVMKSWGAFIPAEKRKPIYDNTKQELIKLQDYKTSNPDKDVDRLKAKLLKAVEDDFKDTTPLDTSSKDNFVKSMTNLVARHKKYTKHSYNKQALDGVSKVENDTWKFIKKLIAHSNVLSKYSGAIINRMLRGDGVSETNTPLTPEQQAAIANNKAEEQTNQEVPTQNPEQLLGPEANKCYQTMLKYESKYLGVFRTNNVGINAFKADSIDPKLIKPMFDENKISNQEVADDFNASRNVMETFRKVYLKSGAGGRRQVLGLVGRRKGQNEAWSPYIEKMNSIEMALGKLYLISSIKDPKDVDKQLKNLNKKNLIQESFINDMSDCERFDVYTVNGYGITKLIAENATVEIVKRITALDEFKFGSNESESGIMYAIAPNMQSYNDKILEGFGFDNDDDDDDTSGFKVVQISEFGVHNVIAKADSFTEAKSILESYVNESCDEITSHDIINISDSRFIIE